MLLRRLRVAFNQTDILKGVFFMTHSLALISYTLAALSGVCFVAGIAILSGGRT